MLLWVAGIPIRVRHLAVHFGQFGKKQRRAAGRSRMFVAVWNGQSGTSARPVSELEGEFAGEFADELTGKFAAKFVAKFASISGSPAQCLAENRKIPVENRPALKLSCLTKRLSDSVISNFWFRTSEARNVNTWISSNWEFKAKFLHPLVRLLYPLTVEEYLEEEGPFWERL